MDIMQGWSKYELREINDVEKRAVICGVSEEEVRKDVKAVMLAISIEESVTVAQSVYNRGRWPIFCFSKGGKGGIRRKTYLENVGGRLPTNFWPFSETGHTDEAKKEMLAIFGGKATFDTPKPVRLLEFILTIAGGKETLILDSFAGSGTTAHAVLNMNKADGGNRKFILVEMMDYADSITAERVKRVINGYGEGKKAVEGTGGSFSYYELGPVLLQADGNLNEEVGADKIRAYVYYMETRQSLPARQDPAEPYLLGVCRDTAYYFYYERSRVTTLDYDFLSTIKTGAEGYIIYADLCAVPQETLRRYNITFKKIPRDIARL